MKIMTMIKQLFCRHDFVFSHRAPIGNQVVRFNKHYNCSKCSKPKMVVSDTP